MARSTQSTSGKRMRIAVTRPLTPARYSCPTSRRPTQAGRYPRWPFLHRPGPLQRRGQVLRQGRLKLQLLTHHRVPKAQSRAVQELTLQAVAAGVPVARIPCDRVSDRRKMGADLMGAAGLQTCLHQGVAGQRLDDREVRARLAWGPAPHRAALRSAVVTTQWGIDRAHSGAQAALDQCEVGAPHLVSLDLCRQTPVGLVAAGDEHQPRGVLVQPVDDPRPLWIIASPQELAENIDERVPTVPRSAVYDQARRLVHDGQPLVRVDDARLEARIAHPSMAGRVLTSRTARHHGSLEPHPGPGFGSASSRLGAGLSDTSTSPSAPRVIATSARLNAGQSGGSMKSVTASSLTRSARLPSAPPVSRPTASHIPGRFGSRANQTSTRASATIVTASTNPRPCPIPNARPEFAVLLRRKPSGSCSYWPTESDDTTIALVTWSTRTIAPQTARARRQPLRAAALNRMEVTR